MNADGGSLLPQREDVRAHVLVVVRLRQLDGVLARDVERIGCRIGHEHVPVVADEVRRPGLEQSMSKDDLRADELALSGDVLDHERTCVQYELEVEPVDPRARVAPARRDGVHVVDSMAEVRIAFAEAVESLLPPGDGRRVVRVGEDRVSLELRQRERRHEAPDDPIQQAREDLVRLRDTAVCERIVSMHEGHRLEERRVAADVGKDERAAREARCGRGAQGAAYGTTSTAAPRRAPRRKRTWPGEYSLTQSCRDSI